MLAQPAARASKGVFVEQFASRDDDEIRPILLAEDGEYVEEFWRARRGELRDREVELPGVRPLLFNGPASLHLNPERSRQVLGDQKVVTDIDLGHRDLPPASQELRNDGVFTGLADVEVVLLHYTPSWVELGKALRWVQELEVAHLVKLLASKPGQDFCNHPPQFLSAEDMNEVLSGVTADEHAAWQRAFFGSHRTKAIAAVRFQLERASVGLRSNVDGHLVRGRGHAIRTIGNQCGSIGEIGGCGRRGAH